MEMPLDVLFYVFAAMTGLPLIYLVFTKNIIRAAFAFTVSLLGLAAIYVLLNADFMAAVQIMIYAGGIVVLLIFGVMLTKRTTTWGVFTEHHFVIPAILVVGAMMAFLVKAILDAGKSWQAGGVSALAQTKKIGVLYLTDHLIAFELIAFLLLVALVGAAFLAKKADQ